VLAAAALAFLVTSATERPVAAAPPPEMAAPGSLNVIVKPGEKLLTCPLQHTEVEAWVAGDIADVQVTQRFGNPYEEPIEAVYVFPLPENSAVDDMVMRIGRRTIRGVIKEREEAKEIYEEAKRAGKTASLLEQERPNIFTQSVANVMPGETIEVTIWYVQDLSYDRGRYEFAFPMVVGPRYIPGAPLPGPDTGGGWAPDTDRVPDASRITPPVLKPDERTGHDIALTLHLEAGVPAYDLQSKSHDIVEESYAGQPLVVSLAPHDTLPNKDFVLSWRVAGEKPEVGLLTHHDGRSGYFALILQPKASFEPAEITPKEMVFCLDTSGSMTGLPIEKSKEVVRQCLDEMGPWDTFQVIRFAGDSSTFSPKPAAATPPNIAKAKEFINQMQGGGGTEMLKGIEASLAFPADPKRVRIVAFLTDGYIGNESEILHRIEEGLGSARIFSFGIGSSVNRYLLRKMAQLGRGEAQFVRQDENPDEAVRSFVDRISRPFLTDIEIDWGGLDVQDTYPPYVPDLFADQPVVLHGRYGEPGRGDVSIRGRVAGEPWETRIEADLPAEEPDNEALGTLWARSCIEDLMDQMYGREDAGIKAQVIDLSLAYRVMSQYTAFVAVEEKIVNRDGQQVTVQVPVPMPEGVSYEGVFGPLAEADARTRYGGGMRGGMGGGGGARGGGGGMRGGGRAVARPALKGPAGPPGPGGQALARQEADYLSATMRYVPELAWLAVASTTPDGSASSVVVNLVMTARRAIGLPAGGIGVLEPDGLSQIKEAAELRLLVVAGSGPLTLDRSSGAAFVAFVRRGGLVIVDCSSAAMHRSVLNALAKLLPEARLERLSPRHEVFVGDEMPYHLPNGCPVVTPFEGAGPAQGLFIGDRMVAFISRGGLAAAWSKPLSQKTLAAHEMGVNLIAYALQHPPKR
jgi:Ca-activated chloride channel family protein